MLITRELRNDDTARWADWHKLLVAEDGFSMLTTRAERHGLDAETIRRFAAEVNRRNEPCSLHPPAPISAMPRRYFRDVGAADVPGILNQFRTDLGTFLDANRATIRAARVLVDLHVSPEPIPGEYLTAVEDVFRERGERAGIEEVIIMT